MAIGLSTRLNFIKKIYSFTFFFVSHCLIKGVFDLSATEIITTLQVSIFPFKVCKTLLESLMCSIAYAKKLNKF